MHVRTHLGSWVVAVELVVSVLVAANYFLDVVWERVHPGVLQTVDALLLLAQSRSQNPIPFEMSISLLKSF